MYFGMTEKERLVKASHRFVSFTKRCFSVFASPGGATDRMGYAPAAISRIITVMENLLCNSAIWLSLPSLGR